MLRIRLIALIFILALLLAGIPYFSPENEGASVIYAGPNSTHRTIQQAVDNASNGDTIYVEKGYYNESVTVNVPNLVLIGNSSTECRVKHRYIGTSSIDYAAAFNITADSVQIMNFNISVSGKYTFGIHLNSNDNRITGNRINTTGVNGHALYLLGSNGNNILNNTIDTLNDSAYGIFMTISENNFIYNNTINTTGKWGYGMYIYSSSKNTILENNFRTTFQFGYGFYILSNSNSNNFISNEINTSFSSAIGFLLSSVVGNNITNNTIITTGINAIGIRLTTNAMDNNFTENQINTTNTNAYGIELISSSNNDFYLNRINTTGGSAHGINVFDSTHNNYTGNTIETNGGTAVGIQFNSNCDTNNITGNTVITRKTGSHGIYIYTQSDDNLVKHNDINTSGSSAYGLYLFNTNSNRVRNNGIGTVRNNADGIRLSTAIGNLVWDNRVRTISDDAVGIYLLTGSDKNDFINNTINTAGNLAYGIYSDGSSRNEIIENIIGTVNSNAHGLYLYGGSSSNNLTMNEVSVGGPGTRAILINQNSVNNSVEDNNITISVTGAPAIEIIQFSDDNEIINQTVVTTNPNEHAIAIDLSNNTRIVNNNLTAIGPSSNGIMLDGLFATVVNSTVSSVIGSDLYAFNEGNLTVINCSFTSVDSFFGVIQVKNFLHIQAYYDDGSTPIPGADFKVSDNGTGDVYYASSGYGGTDDKTDSNGRVEFLVIDDHWYTRTNTPKFNSTNITVKKTLGRSWEEVRTNVSMNTSHTEIFKSIDITPPAPPTSISAARIGITNGIKIAWALNTESDIFKYRIENNDQGPWVEIANVSHPKSFHDHTGLTERTWYHYRLQAWDTANLGSTYSSIVSIFLPDITPPAVPVGLSAAPVQNDDKIELSWTLNSDDTAKYEIWWKNPSTGKYEKIDNVSHPSNSVQFSHPSLVDGSFHSFMIRAIDDLGNPSAFTTNVSVIHKDELGPANVLNLKAKTYSYSAINLTWSPSPDIDVVGYHVLINESGKGDSGKYVLENSVTTTFYNVSFLNANISYYFLVQAYDEAGNPSDGAKAGAKTFPKPIPIPPGLPVMDKLPAYTNKAKLNVTGTSDPSIEILIYNNNNLVSTGNSDTAGRYRIEISMIIDDNEIKAKARNAEMLLSEFTETQKVIYDKKAPVANAGKDLSTPAEEVVIFDASLSSDNYGIKNYTWSFDDGNQAGIKLFGAAPEYVFYVEGVYNVTLDIQDLAGNSATDILAVTVTKALEKPELISTFPDTGDGNVPVNITVVLTFSIPMNTITITDVISFLPERDYHLIWSENNKVLEIDFSDDLDYNTTYTLTLGNATAAGGGRLKNTPIEISFTTAMEPVIQPSDRDVSMGPLSKAKFEPGEKLTITGTSSGFDAGTVVSVTIWNNTENGTIDADGNWSITMNVPDDEGIYTVIVTIGNKTSSASITVEKEEIQPPPDTDDKKGDEKSSGFNNLLYIGLFVIIILLAVLGAFFMMKRKTKTEQSEEDERKDLDEEEEEEEKEEKKGDAVEDDGFSDADLGDEDEGFEDVGDDEVETEKEEEFQEEDEYAFDDIEDEEEEDMDGLEEEEETYDEDIGEEDFLDDDLEEEDQFDDFDDELRTVDCPKCGSLIEVERSGLKKVSLVCNDCGAKGKIPNPYL